MSDFAGRRRKRVPAPGNSSSRPALPEYFAVMVEHGLPGAPAARERKEGSHTAIIATQGFCCCHLCRLAVCRPVRVNDRPPHRRPAPSARVQRFFRASPPTMKVRGLALRPPPRPHARDGRVHNVRTRRRGRGLRQPPRAGPHRQSIVYPPEQSDIKPSLRRWRAPPLSPIYTERTCAPFGATS